MSLVFHQKLLIEGDLGLWRIEESEEFYLEHLTLYPKEVEAVALMKGDRKREWLAGRWLLHHMSGRAIRGACLRDEFGKPYLEDSLYHISISHSRELTSVIAAPQAVGVDIQKLVLKIERIAHKYMREEEMNSLVSETRLEHLHVYWGAKESLYKAYGRRQLDFRQHIIVEPFDYDLEKGICRGWVKKGDYDQSFDIHYRRIEDYILVYALAE